MHVFKNKIYKGHSPSSKVIDFGTNRMTCSTVY